MKHLITSGSLIEGTFGAGRALTPRVGNLEAVVLEPADDGAFTLRHFWREQTAPDHEKKIRPRPDLRWQAGRDITTVATGAGAICQRRDKGKAHGDFEVVVPEPGELVHYSFDNSAADARSWTRRVIAQSPGSGPGAVIENRINEHLEALMLEGSSLVHYEFDGVAWHRRAEITNRATGAPALIQSSYNSNLEVIVPEGADLVLYWRDRAGIPPRWKPGGTVAKAGDGPVGFVQGRYGTAPNLNFEVVIPRGDVLDTYWRDNARSERPWGRAGWATWGAGPVTAASMCWSYLGTGCLQALSQEGSSIYHLHRYEIPDGFRWMRSSCFRLEDTSLVDKSDSPRSVRQAQVTGERDAAPPHGTLSNSDIASGIRGTDLGVTVHHNQRALMLFGDTHWHDKDQITLDAIGEVIPRGTALPMLVLHGSPLRIVGSQPDPRTTDREYDVPLDAFSLGGELFTFFSSNHFADSRVMGRSVLTRAVDASLPIRGQVRDRPLEFTFLTELSSFRFINVAVQLRRAADVPGMGHEGDVLLVWGTGAYRADDLRLAIIRLTPVLDSLFGDGEFPTERLATIYFNGLSGNTPVWSPIEHDARPLFSQSALGEISVRWVAELGLYVLLSMSLPSQHGTKDGIKGGVFMRVSPTPWGPWSHRREVFNWQRDGAHFIRMTDASTVGDCVFKEQCESHGGAYAPYLFDVKWEGHTAALRYTLSTWNPYQVMLMRHDITRFELRDLTRSDSIPAVIDLGVAPSPRLSRTTGATLAFGGFMGDRIAANQRNWLLAAPTANPAMLGMFKDRDRPTGEQNLLVWSGEYAGKYLIGAVQGLRLTGDRHLRAEIKSVADELMSHQASEPFRDGYLGPFGIEHAMSGRRQRPAPGGGVEDEAVWDMWGQYHCMLGLYYVYKETNDAAALAACRRAADWFCRRFFDNDRLETDVAEWRFARQGGATIAESLRLLPDGRIEGHQHPHEAYWKQEPDGLSFYTKDNIRTTAFKFHYSPATGAVHTGKFLLDDSITHVLTQNYHPAPAQNHASAHIFALLYQETQDPNYLRMLRKLEHAWQLTGGNLVEAFQAGRPLFQGNNAARRWESLHTAQAVAELYLITGSKKYFRALTAIWESIRASDRHNTGGFSSLEEATGNPYNPRPIETCATVAWAALSVDMLRLTMAPRVADELELTTWNAVLGAQNADGRWWTYDTPMGGIRTDGMKNLTLPPPLGNKPPIAVGERRPARYDLHFQDTPTRGTSHLSCCTANGPRGLGTLSEWAVMTATDGGITLNYYGPSVFTLPSPSGRDVSIVQETDYPVSGRISIAIFPASAEEFRLRLRIPAWSKTTGVRINGTARADVVAGEYLTIDRLWSPGDTIELMLDMGPHYVRGGAAPPHTNADNDGSAERLVCIYHGPLLLAYDKRLNEHDPMRVPMLLDSEPPVPVEGDPGAPRPLVMLRFPTITGPITLCDFASAGLDFPTPAPQRPNPFVGWQFGRGDGTVITSQLRLQPNGSISGHSHPNEARWVFEGDVLVFYAQNGSPSTRFSWSSIEDGRHVLRGVALFDRRIVHVLREDDVNEWTRAWHFGRADGHTIAERLVLVAGGSIVGHTSPNEARWGVEGGTLVFYLNDGRPSTRFQWVVTENGQRILRGAFLPDRSVTHVLSELDTAVLNKVWTFSREATPETPIAQDMQLLPGGTISGYSHPNEARWAFEGHTLVFYTAHWVASTRFTLLQMHHGRPEWRGPSLFDGSVTHILRERDLSVTNKLWRFARKNVPAIDLRLLANHQIDGADSAQESRWDVDQEELLFYAAGKAEESARFGSPTSATSVDMFDFTGAQDRERRTKRVANLSPGVDHELKESNIDLGWVGGSPYVTWFRTRSDQVLARDVTPTAVSTPADTVPRVLPPLQRSDSTSS